MNTGRTAVLLSFFVLAAAGGCAGKKTLKTNYSKTIALLPFDNHSNDIEAPEKVREILFNEMQKKGYRLMPLDKTDAVLREQAGISEGGQLAAIPFEKLKESIPEADYFTYGTIEEYVFRSAVALSQRKVQLQLKIVEADTGKIIFEEEETGVTSTGGTNAAGDLALNVTGKIFKSVKDGVKKVVPGNAAKKTADATDAIADVDLEAETHEAVRKLLTKMEKSIR